MELSYRLELLRNGGQISLETNQFMLKIIEMFQVKLCIKLTEENGAMFITHLAIACERMKKNEKIDPMHESAYGEVKGNSNYSRSEAVLEDIEKEIGIRFLECEKTYIILHLCSIL